VFEGKLLKVDRLRVELDNGMVATREIVRFPEVVVVIAFRDNGDCLLVKQFRKPIESVLLEAVAGKVDLGESPEMAARRELKEETGYDVKRIEKIGMTYPTPGYSTEVQHYFGVIVDDNPSRKSCDDDELVDPVWMSGDDCDKMFGIGSPMDGKLVTALWFLHLTQFLKGECSDE